MITRKIKIGKFFYSLPRSIQNIAHHFQSLFDGVISEGGGGLYVLLCDTAYFFNCQQLVRLWNAFPIFLFSTRPDWENFYQLSREKLASLGIMWDGSCGTTPWTPQYNSAVWFWRGFRGCPPRNGAPRMPGRCRFFCRRPRLISVVADFLGANFTHSFFSYFLSFFFLLRTTEKSISETCWMKPNFDCYYNSSRLSWHQTEFRLEVPNQS